MTGKLGWDSGTYGETLKKVEQVFLRFLSTNGRDPGFFNLKIPGFG
jgi:hypothetical protein